MCSFLCSMIWNFICFWTVFSDNYKLSKGDPCSMYELQELWSYYVYEQSGNFPVSHHHNQTEETV